MNILIVNINGLKYTEPLVRDLFVQDSPYQLTVVDNGSVQIGTRDFMDSLLATKIKVQYNTENVDLSRIWNDFYHTSFFKDDLLCFLNNDVRIPPNFVSDTIKVFERESSVGCVVHASGDPKKYSKDLSITIPEKKFCQGWDFTIRKEAYTAIPDNIKMFGGDDFLFSNLYLKGWKVAVIHSSPIIHFNAKSRKWYKGDRNEQVRTYLNYGYEPLPHGAHHVC